MRIDIINLSFYTSLIAYALICCTFLIYSFSTDNNSGKKIKKALLAYFVMKIFFGFFFLLSQTGIIQLKGRAYPFLIFSIAIYEVVYFNFIYLLTNKHLKTALPVFHYIFPIVLFATILFFFNLLYSRIDSLKELNQHMIPYSLSFFLLYRISYICLSLKYIFLYKKELQKSSSSIVVKRNTSWLFYIIVIKLCFVITFIVNHLYLDQKTLFPIHVVLVFFESGIIIFNILEKNYSFLNPLKDNIVLASSGHIFSSSCLINSEQNTNNSVIISQQEFENYFRDHKPYLVSSLKIGDVAAVFNTNKLYMSKFINDIYNVNFKQYINAWRINEVKKLSELNDNKSMKELSKMAGFGSLRSYWRYVKTISPEDKHNF